MSESPSTYSDTTAPYPPVDPSNVQPSHTTADPEQPEAFPPHIYANQNVTPLAPTQQPYPAQQEPSPPRQQQPAQIPRLAPSSKPARSNQQDRFNRNRGHRGTSNSSTDPMEVYFKVIIIFTAISTLFVLPLGLFASLIAVYAQKQFDKDENSKALVASWIAAGIGLFSIISSISVIVLVSLIYSGFLIIPL